MLWYFSLLWASSILEYVKPCVLKSLSYEIKVQFIYLVLCSILAYSDHLSWDSIMWRYIYNLRTSWKDNSMPSWFHWWILLHFKIILKELTSSNSFRKQMRRDCGNQNYHNSTIKIVAKSKLELYPCYHTLKNR